MKKQNFLKKLINANKENIDSRHFFSNSSTNTDSSQSQMSNTIKFFHNNFFQGLNGVPATSSLKLSSSENDKCKEDIVSEPNFLNGTIASN